MLDQLVVGFHIHVHMGVRKGADRLPAFKITTGLRGGSEKVQFGVIVHRYSMTVRTGPILTHVSLDGNWVLA